MKTFEIVWFIAIMLLCAIADGNNTVVMLALCVLAIPFVVYLIAKAAKQEAINEAERIKKEVETAIKAKK